MTPNGQPMRENALRLLVDALRIYSPSEKEGALAEMLSKRMSGELGFRDVRIDEAGNVIGEVGSGKKLHLLLCGHMDTVPGELPVRLDDENVFGRGAADAKSPLCAMIMASSMLKTDGLQITLAAVTREEGDSLGIHRVIERGGDYDFAVFGEPAGASKITIGYRGRMAVRVTVRTDGGHASSPWAHTSAVDESMRLLGRVQEYEKAHSAGDNKNTTHYHSMSTCLTLIEGGTFSNVVPDVCRMTLDIRVPVGMKCSRVREDFMALAETYAIENPHAKIELSFDEATEPYESDSSSLLVRSFQRSIIKNLSEKPVLIHKTGTGDMNTLAERMAIPTITYGPGDSRLEHTNHEAVAIRDYLRSIDVLRGVFDELVALSAPRQTKKNRNSG